MLYHWATSAYVIGACRGTRTHTVTRQNLNLVRLPIPPYTHLWHIMKAAPSDAAFALVTPPGIEPGLPPWKGGVLTAWPWSHKNRQRPTFPGSFPPSIISAKELNYCVRDGNRCGLFAIVTGFSYEGSHPQNWTMFNSFLAWNHWSSVRPISIGQLNVLPHLHLRPINVIVSHGSYLTGEI